MKSVWTSVIGRLAPGARVFRYSEDFVALWNPEGWSRWPGVSVVIWDETPDDNTTLPIDSASRLTPIDWATVFLSQTSDTAVVVIDGDPAGHSELSSVRALRSLNPVGLRLRLIRPSHFTAVGKNEWPSMLEIEATHNAEGLETLLRLIRLDLTDPAQPDDRHAIANLLGPMLLGGNTVESQIPDQGRNRLQPIGPHWAALKVLATRLGLVVDSRLPQLSGPPLGDSTVLVLVDDQAHMGWEPWLQNVVGRQSQVVFENFDLFVDRLELGRDQRFCLRLSAAAKEGKAEILLLDLRLFAGNEQSERDFVQKLIPLCKQKTDFAGLPWPGFTSKEICAAQDWVEAKCAEAPRVARTLLPRLISLADMSLPIIIFSSTSDRGYIEPLKDYGNIITVFKKPTHFTSESAEVSRQSLLSAFDAAKRILRARHACWQIANTDTPARTLRSEDKHIDIYLDESGSQGGRIGGAIISFESQYRADALSAHLRKAGVCWGQDSDRTSGVSAATLKKTSEYPRGTPIPADISKLRSALANADIRWAACHVTYPQQPDQLTDSRFRHALSQALRLILFDWLPFQAGNVVSLRVFGGTRTLHLSATALLEQRDRFGLALRTRRAKPTTPGERRCNAKYQPNAAGSHEMIGVSFAASDLLPVVQALLREAGPDSAGRFTLASALAVALPYERQLPIQAHEYPRQIHYLADWIASRPDLFKDDIARGFTVAATQIEPLARLSRLAERAETVAEAIASWGRPFGLMTRDELRKSGAAYTAERLKRRLATLSGADFMRSVRLIDQ